MTLKRKIGIRLGGPQCGSEIRTTMQSELHSQGAYIITKERDSSGRVIFRWEFGNGKGVE